MCRSSWRNFLRNPWNMFWRNRWWILWWNSSSHLKEGTLEDFRKESLEHFLTELLECFCFLSIREFKLKLILRTGIHGEISNGIQERFSRQVLGDILELIFRGISKEINETREKLCVPWKKNLKFCKINQWKND